MSDLTRSRAERRRQRDAIGTSAAELARARAESAALAFGEASASEKARINRRYDKALKALAKAKEAEKEGRARIEDQLRPFRGRPEDAYPKLDAGVTVAFFPVRIETRFRRDPQGGGELKVRIYPDSILANEHEPLLTASEVEAGRAYWRKAWRDGDERDAWILLLASSMAPRAAWIVLKTAPSNAAERPSDGETPEPQFPDLETRPDGWHRAPEARCLPERWLVSAWRGGQPIHRVPSEPVREGLALTFRLSADGEEDEGLDSYVELTADGLSVEPEVLWTYDFGEAVAVGMAVTIKLTKEDFDKGFELLTVMGVRTSEEPEAQAAELAETLAFNNYSRQVAFVPQGAKTNNSADTPTDYPPADPAGATSFATYRGASLSVPGADGERFMRALGLEPDTAAHFWGADRDEQARAVAMGDCLWPATFGYYLKEMIAPEASPAFAASLKQFARTHVRGRGPFPAFRVGPAPYGLLPVSALDRWTGLADGDAEDWLLLTVLKRLAGLWLDASDAVQRIGSSADPDADLIAVLSQDASAQEVQVRRAVGKAVTRNLWALAGLDPAPLDAAELEVATAAQDLAGEPAWDPRILHLHFAASAHDFAGPLIEDLALSETEGLAFNYLAWLRNADLKHLKDQQPPTPVGALLYLMLRHGLLTEFDVGAKDLLDWRSLLHPAELREAEFIGIGTSEADEVRIGRTAWERLETRIPGVTAEKGLGDYLDDRTLLDRPVPPPVVDAATRIQAFRDSLQRLETLPTAELHRLFTETLDLSSHRLDAWLIGLYSSRLERMREARGQGLYVGAYGWVENLKADPPGETRTVTGPDGNRREAAIDAGGHIHAPSMLHAAASAVLRSAFLSRSGSARQPYAIDLSSTRVRTALWLVDTVREDQPLGAALGYKFERGLHEKHPGVELDRFIDDFRRLYPLVANKAEDSGEPADSVAARNVVDGLRLHAAFLAGTIPFSDPGLSPDTTQRQAIDEELRRLDESVDAVSDLMTAEAVYQVVKGSSAGVSASLDSLAKGTRAPEIEIASTPRSGTVLHQRCIIVLGNDPLPPDWAALPSSPSANAAPEFNAWLGRMLGSPDTIRCSVSIDGGAAQPVTVADLKLQPIDLFHLARGAESGASGNDLDRRIAWRAAGTAGPDRPIAIDYDSEPAAGGMTFAQLFEVASAIGKVLGMARPLAPADLLPPELQKLAAEADVLAGELATQAGDARTELDQVLADLEAALTSIAASPVTADAALLKAALIRAANFGIAGAFPPARHDASEQAHETLLALAGAARTAIRDRAKADDSAPNPLQRLQALFGASFIAVPRFRPAAPEILGPALSQEPDIEGRSDAEIEGWLAGLARVREPLAAWRQFSIYQRAFGKLVTRPRIAQLPLETQPSLAKWAALSSTSGERPRPGLVSIAFLGDQIPGVGEAWSGLLLDTWPELIPNFEEDTAIAFHHDAPGAQAPQAVLLGVPPPGAETWSFELVEGCLLHALELAKIRSVDLSHLPALGQLLPAAFLAANPRKAIIGTSFAGLLRADAIIAAAET
jgi:hypothetical protein